MLSQLRRVAKGRMKKLQRFKRKKAESAEAPHRITNETVAEHRERILAGGRRFKYPVQYAKHRLVINTIVISVVALLLVALVIWWQLYPSQNTSTFFYRITRVLPLPVAVVDGRTVPYSDYLEGFKSQEHYLEFKQGVNLYSKENKTQLDWFKRQALNDAIADTYAAKLADQKGITVTDNEVNDAIKQQRQSSDGEISEKTYYDITLDHYGWTQDEVREVTARNLLRQKVAYDVDATAAKLRVAVEEKLKTDSDFDKIAAAITPLNGVKVEASVTPLVPLNNRDGGLAEHASKLAVGKVSTVFRSTTGDGYYVVKLLQREGDRISYSALKIALTEFQKRLSDLKSNHKVSELISVPEVKAPASS